MNAASSSENKPAKRWPRVHLIYFVLAAFDLLAVIGGLYLSHRLAGVFEDNAAVSTQWSERFRSVWNLSEQAAAINTPGNSVFESHDTNGERQRLASAARTFATSLTNIQSDLIRHIPTSSLTRVSSAFAGVRSSAEQIRKSADRVLDFYAAGDLVSASAASAQMERYYEEFKRKLDATAAFMMTIQAQLNQQHSDTVTRLRRFEYVIGAGIALMVLCVATYGLWVGRIMRAKFIELELARAESQSFAEDLQRVNSDISNLNRDLADKMRELSEAQDEIVRRGKLAQLGRLTAAVARELRNPLGAMRTSTFLIDRKIKDREFDIAPQLQRVNNGIARCDRIVSQLMDLALSREPQRETLPVDDWLAKIIEEGAEKFPVGIDIECRLGLGGVKALFDAGLMQRVVGILMDNAAHAVLERKSGWEQSAVEGPRIIIDTHLSPRGVAISISDNGPGILPDLMAKIREPLFTTKKDGVGLGLPTAEKILTEHGGGLDISSTSEGSVFTAWIPLVKDQRKAA